MKTFREFMSLTEAYDADVMSRSQIRKTGEGGRIGAERKKTAPERRRVKAVGGGKTVPAKEYKPNRLLSRAMIFASKTRAFSPPLRLRMGARACASSNKNSLR